MKKIPMEIPPRPRATRIPNVGVFWGIVGGFEGGKMMKR
jgi:hypothetical protein